MAMFNIGPSNSNQYRTQGGYMGTGSMGGGMGITPQDNSSGIQTNNMQAGGIGPNPQQLQMLLKLLGSNSSMQPMGGGFSPMNMNPGPQGISGGGFTGGFGG